MSNIVISPTVARIFAAQDRTCNQAPTENIGKTTVPCSFFYGVIYKSVSNIRSLMMFLLIEVQLPWQFTPIFHLFLWNAVQTLSKIRGQIIQIIVILFCPTLNACQTMGNKDRKGFNFIIQIRKLLCGSSSPLCHKEEPLLKKKMSGTTKRGLNSKQGLLQYVFTVHLHIYVLLYCINGRKSKLPKQIRGMCCSKAQALWKFSPAAHHVNSISYVTFSLVSQGSYFHTEWQISYQRADS